ncbi:acyl-ACP--UDP-N-acetylglucosamine O-acyltransferase [Candidatus Methylacidithermus pantelleriae]|uniref:Acyl-(Acyl-carrier-protein)--UDP-N-acetylglucosamine O-acyltransferase n=1 Tax=Candidatus Methylacidithermus pantelleriae TaxID=2744239 RepID=A0A8J2FSA3_9BACT|nr:acyl-ACP--UDP-N-acetylglucosamine O-acyltransferase [Candidatus Methylacidithermus pantelleriae]CAF0697455.1 Acyl-(acyl-carrier-protein)--UDP-N-acetylglucosamine O-acyltransferase [Candidatus Methylacidithermus pantelleriae]
MACSIHPQALVSPGAFLGEGVQVGPGAIIEDGCFIGDRTCIGPYAYITGRSWIGKDNQIGYGAVVGLEPQDHAFAGDPSQVVIGDRNVIREHVTIHRATGEGAETRIGNDNYLMVGSHVAHNCRIANRVTLVNHVLLAGYVEVGEGATLGGAAVVHQHVRIGAFSMTRGQTRLGKDLPPFFVARDTNEVCGINRVGLSRAGFSEADRRQILEAYRILYRSGRNVSQALEEMEKRWKEGPVAELIAFIRSSRRGICMERCSSRSWETGEEG